MSQEVRLSCTSISHKWLYDLADGTGDEEQYGEEKNHRQDEQGRRQRKRAGLSHVQKPS